MGIDELSANIFRISLAKQKIENEKIMGEGKAKEAHYQVGKNVREVIIQKGGTAPEELPTPKKSLKELEFNNKLKIS